MTDWSLRYEGFNPAQEPLREALCTLGNGYFATRGAAEEAEADQTHYPGTYLAGGYNRLETEIAGRVVENEDLVNMPNWLFLTFRPADGDWLNLLRFEILSYRQELDLNAGVLRREMQVRDRQGRETTLTSRRIVHMGDPHLAAIQWSLRPENWSGPVVVRSALDGRVINAGVARYRELNGKHLAPVETRLLGDDAMLLVVETNQSHIRAAEAARTQVFQGEAPIPVKRQNRQEEGYVAQDLTFEMTQGQAVTIEKVVALYTSRDRAISEAGLAAAEAIDQAERFDALLARHSRIWTYLWQRCDIVLEGKQRAQMILRLHIFHLLQTVSPHTADLDVGVPARGWHGEAYRGHIFWDELFIFPFLNFRIPELTRALLRYRYRRLPMARRLAKEAGYRGAMYPWQSGSSGREESQVLHLNPRSGRWIPDNSHLQRHVSAAVAYNVWRYYEVTDDAEFLSYYGAEMLIEIARFWASIAVFNPERDRYEIRGVMGPDEFHDRYPWAETPGLDNNAYTNVMAAWVLCRALDAFNQIDDDRRRELRGALDLDEREIEDWKAISRKMFVPFHAEGIISQFEGYERLEEFDWDEYQEKYGDIHRLDRLLEAEGDTVNRYKASKQADALMLFYLFSSDELRDLFDRLGYALAPEAIPRIVDYYARRTSHGSTLSRIVDSWVLARADRPRSWLLLEQALESDIADIQGGTTPEGIHLGAMAGTVDLVQRGQIGLEIRDGVLRLNPCLPEALQGLCLRLRYRGHWLDLDIGCERMRVSAPNGWVGPETISIRDQAHPFKAGDVLEFRCHLENGGWRPVTQDATRRQQRKTGA
jgi:alpha,alpha-trehalase